VPSAFVTRIERDGVVRFRVRYRLGGRESLMRSGGSFSTQREARARRDWIAGELAACRVPDLRLAHPEAAPTFATVAEKWRASRIDVTTSTATTHGVNLGRILPTFGETAIDRITPEDVAAFVGTLTLKRESIRKTLATFAMVLAFHEIVPNPVRDKRVKLPQEDRSEVSPPTAAHVVAALGAVPPRYRLPILTLDATGMRVTELEALTWGDVDEPAGRWRVTQATAKTSMARWVPVPDSVFRAVADLVPREDRDLDVQVFAGFGADRLRTAIKRGCKATGIPAFSPHDLRHRRASLWHLQGVPVAEAAGWLGHSPQEYLKTYAHVVMDRTEIVYADLLEPVAVLTDEVELDYLDLAG